MQDAKPTVFVVDDDESIRRSLKLLIEDIGLDVETYGSAQDFLTEYNPARPGCLVLDVRMAQMSGLELHAKLGELNIDLPTIVITGHADVPMAVQAMKAGVFDFVEKPFRDQVLLDSIHRAIEADAQVRRERAGVLDVEARLSLLTDRECEVMEMLTSAMNGKTVAYKLGISQKTVDFHRANMLEKMGVDSVVELVHLRQRLGRAGKNLAVAR